MFELKNTQYRNLEEQVQKNKEDIARHYNIDRVLADFGITVLGRVNTYEDIANLDEGENWGYGYLVGPEDDPNGYVVYVWTRPNADIGKDTAYWLNIGKISIVGPQGPAGRSITNISINANYQLVFTFSDGSTLTLAQPIRGPQGSPGINGKTPSITATREANGVRVKTFNGDGTLTNSVFIPDGQRGMTGATGPRGENATLNIIGTFASLEQAPDPQTRELGDAFLLSNGGLTTLYVLTGTPDIISTYSWQETSFGGGTRVTVDNQTQSVWNADTKLDKLVGHTQSVYTFIDPWSTYLTPISTELSENSIPVRDLSGTFSVANPSQQNHPTTKSYVDEITNDIQTLYERLDTRVSSLESNSGGGGSTGGGGWNVITSPEGTPLSFNPGNGTFFEMMLCSEHGMGDNTFTSNVFLFKAEMSYAYSTTQIIPVGALGVNTADLSFYWKLDMNYPPEGTVYTFTPIYNADPSTIHNVKLYYREV